MPATEEIMCVFISLFIFNIQALESGGNPVSLGVLPLSSERCTNVFSY